MSLWPFLDHAHVAKGGSPKGWQAKPGLGRAHALTHATRWILQSCCEQANLVLLNTFSWLHATLQPRDVPGGKCSPAA